MTDPQSAPRRQSRPWLRLLHLLWALPLATLLSAPLLFLAAISECGISGCGGGGFGVATGGRIYVPLFTWGIGGVFFLALIAAPWVRPWRLRLAIGLIVGVLIGLIFTVGIASQAVNR